MMKLWFKKVSVVLITFMTLGIYIPPTYLDASLENEELITSSESNNSLATEVETDDVQEDESTSDSDESHRQYVAALTEQAKMQTISKLGPRIVDQIEVDFMSTIMPNIETVIEALFADVPSDDVPYFTITEQPSAGYGEKIFNLYDYRTNEDLARFHVRRVNRPQEGYWFNFHYHLKKDDFVEHYEIGEIYWNKNTPPKWMS